MQWVQDDDENWSMIISFEMPKQQTGIWLPLFMALGTLLAITVYISVLTRIKF